MMVSMMIILPLPLSSSQNGEIKRIPISETFNVYI